MAALILMLAGAVVWLEVDAMRRVGKSSIREVEAANQARPNAQLQDLLAQTAEDIGALLHLRACWFEPFPFDALLPRIEEGRIVLPTPEPGVAPCSDAGVELPVRMNDLTLGRFVLQPETPTVGVLFAPSARDRAIAMAENIGPTLAVALISGAPTQQARPAR